MALALERIVAAGLALTVFVFAFASSSPNSDWSYHYGRPARWVCLAALLGLSLAYAFALGRRGPATGFLGVTAGLVALALASVLWSVDPRLTLERGVTLAVLIATGTALFYGTRGRIHSVRLLLLGLLAGMTAVALAGLVVLLVARDKAIQPATFEYPARYRGFEQNPNTVGLLLAIATPLAVLFVLEAGSQRRRAVALAVVALLAGSIAFSGSRGAMLAALAGTLVLVVGRGEPWRRRLGLVVVTVGVFAACVAVSRIPQPRSESAPPVSGRAPPAQRTLFTSSGRVDAWRGAIEQAAERPVAGYGFGTEQHAFVNRYPGFVSELPENSYIGAALQLGLAGLVALFAVAASALFCFARVLRRPPAAARLVAAASAGAAVSALVLGLTQSYLFSVGSIGTTSAWLSMFLLASVSEAVE